MPASGDGQTTSKRAGERMLLVVVWNWQWCLRARGASQTVWLASGWIHWVERKQVAAVCMWRLSDWTDWNSAMMSLHCCCNGGIAKRKFPTPRQHKRMIPNSRPASPRAHTAWAMVGSNARFSLLRKAFVRLIRLCSRFGAAGREIERARGRFDKQETRSLLPLL